jgi:hypothetical protein
VRRGLPLRRTLALAAAGPIGDARPMPIHEAAMWSAYQQTTYVARIGGASRASEDGASQGDEGDESEDGRGLPSDAAGDVEVAIRVGRTAPELDDLLDVHSAGSWCFVTAANPRSERLDDPLNDSRNGVLKRELQEAGFVVFEGEGRGCDGSWPPEASFLAIGPDREQATRLGVRHGQNAIVYGERGGRAELIDCRGRAESSASAGATEPGGPVERAEDSAFRAPRG